MTFTLEQLNCASAKEAAAMLDGLYEHSPWIAQQALRVRPFASLAQLKHACALALRAEGREAQLALIRAHPELAGKAMMEETLTAPSSHEQGRAGLTRCTVQEFAKLQQLNSAYQERFGWPFILAVRGPRGSGLRKQEIFDAFERRLQAHPDTEFQDCLHNIHRIAELRLNDKFGSEPVLGNELWDWHEQLAQHSEAGFAELGQLTVTYLSPAHRACAAQIAQGMADCGFDEVQIDAVGNVVGRYRAAHPDAKTLATGSHYDTVRNGGKYDGRLGIFVPMMCVRELARCGVRLPFHLEVVGFSEEEGQRYAATFLGSSALVGDFQSAWLDQVDADGFPLRQVMAQAGLQIEQIDSLKRDAHRYLGFVEVHIEQGPVLYELDLPLGVVSSINGSVRFACEVVGVASHAGTTPMGRRFDAATAAAELMLYVEQRAARDGVMVGQHKVDGSVGTVGMLHVPNGSTNVVPGRCQFTLDLRAPTDGQRDALVADVLAQLAAICQRRGLQQRAEQTMRVDAAPSDLALQRRWQKAVQTLGVPLHTLASGAGHDAMKLHQIMPQAMLFVRGQNGGISHNPLESTTGDDMQLAIEAFATLLQQLSEDTP
jgi:N-carbamoyl-L-amino-acid hydrolase